MGGSFGTLARTLFFDDAAYHDWRDRPNLFLRGVVLVLAITLVGGLIGFGVNLVAQVKPMDPQAIRTEMQRSFEQATRMNPSWQTMDPTARRIVENTMNEVANLVVRLAEIRSPLPRGISGLFHAVGSWLSGGLTALGGWLLYGALVLVCVNLLGGSAKLGDFLGMAALYSIPGLIGLLNPLFTQVAGLSCLTLPLTFIGLAWGVAMYVKATSVVANLDVGRATLAVVLPALAMLVLGAVLSVLVVIWLVIVL